jgi:hypothetical protein
MDKHYRQIRQQYLASTGDATELFRNVLALGEKIGLENALGYLQRCVIEKRTAWIEQNLPDLALSDDPVFDGYRLFYEVYLGVSTPKDGEIILQTDHRMVTRWWNHCPTFEACQSLGLETRQICKKAYHKPVDEFLIRIDPRLRFDRNYACLRPHTPYCEEIIFLE